MRVILVLLSAVALTGCAGAYVGGDVAPAKEAVRETGPYGLFLAGHAALGDGRAREAEALFARAAAAAPGNGVVRARAFHASLAAGDVGRAAAAPLAEVEGDDQSLARLTRAVDALARGQGKQAHALLTEQPLSGAHGLTGGLLRPWTAAAAGNWEEALNPAGADSEARRLVAALGEIGRVDLLERAGRHAEAEALVAGLKPAEAPVQTVLRQGAYLERRRKGDRAVALYEQALKARPSDLTLQAALRRARTGGSPPAAPSLRQGAAQALLVPAVVLAGAQQTEGALAYLRLALHLDPKMDEAWVTLGEVLSGQRDLEGARSAFLKPAPGSPQFAAARARLAYVLQEQGRTEEALQAAQSAAALAPSELALQSTYGALLMEVGRNDEAVTLFDRLLAKDAADDWRTWYLRGTAHERAGRWNDAQRDLQHALKLAPEEPEVLNYLGYSWVDRGERLQEALGMIERAVQLRPRSGAIVDSLGWAKYRLGQFEEAVELLERAAELEPGDPTINDHLGDAYWRTGRKVEAHFQWRRVLTLEPEREVRAAAETKLASAVGPDAVSRAVAVRP
ncbi:MAG TPA: tetratricopeptide repeat protein [Caulobacteraceae bacterium]